MKTIAFFNSKGDVGKTTLVYHLAWMYAELGVPVIAADFDPQASLTRMFLPEERLAELWPDGDHDDSVLGPMRPIMLGLGDIGKVHVESLTPNLGIVAGDLGLSQLEATLSTTWTDCMNRREAAFRAASSFHRLLLDACRQRNAEVVLIDVGPNLGAVSRAALIAANHVVFPVAPDIFSLQGLRILGPTLREWRTQWRDRLEHAPKGAELALPTADMQPAGYVVMQHSVRSGQPARAYRRWTARIPSVFAREVRQGTHRGDSTDDDPDCLATLRHYRSLMGMAQEARKPLFALKPADGAIGGHQQAVRDCSRGFKRLAEAIATRCELSW